MTKDDRTEMDIERVEDVITMNREHLVYDDPHVAAKEDNPTEPQKLSWATALAIVFLGLSAIGPISCGFQIVTSILVKIGVALGDTSSLGWIVSGWSIASSVSFTLAGSLSDIFGRRYVILLGELISIIGGIVAATAQSMSAVIAGSTLLGFSCGLVLVSYAAIPELLPFKYRGIGLAWTEVCLYVPWATVGVLLGQTFVRVANWRWPYYISIMYGAVSFVGTAMFYFPPSRPRNDLSKSRWEEFLELDFIGVFLYTSGLSVMLLGLSWGGSPNHEWSSASVIAPIVVGFLTFAGCFAYDWTFGRKKQAFFPLHLFVRFREYTVLLIVVLVAGMIFYTMSGLLPEATTFVFTSNPTEIGLMMLPNGFGQLFFSVVMPSILHKTKNPKMHLIVAIFLQTLFVGLYAYAIDGHKAAWMAFQFFGQGPFSWITIVTLVNAGLHVRQSDLGLAVGLLGTFRSLGGSIGNSVFGTILADISAQQLGPRITEAAMSNGFDTANVADLIPAVANFAAGVPGDVAFAGIPGVTTIIQQVTLQAYRDAWAYSFKMVFYSTIPFGVIAFVAALFIKDAGEYMTNHTSVQMERDVLSQGGSKIKKGEEETL